MKKLMIVLMMVVATSTASFAAVPFLSRGHVIGNSHLNFIC
jgi:hypothetical protein